MHNVSIRRWSSALQECAIHYTQYTLHITQYTVNGTQNTVHSTQHTAHSAQHTAHTRPRLRLSCFHLLVSLLLLLCRQWIPRSWSLCGGFLGSCGRRSLCMLDSSRTSSSSFSSSSLLPFLLLLLLLSSSFRLLLLVRLSPPCMTRLAG